MERQLIDTVEQAEALVGKLVKFEWFDMWEPEKFVGIVLNYDARTTSLRFQSQDGQMRYLAIPYRYEPVHATVFYPGCDMQPDPRPIPDAYGDDDLDDLLEPWDREPLES